MLCTTGADLFSEPRADTGLTIPTNVNEGVRVSAIYKDLQSRAAALAPGKREILLEALALAGRQPAGTGSRVLTPPHPSGNSEGMSKATDRGGTVETSNTNEIRVTIPIEVTLRIGSTAAPATLAPAPAAPQPRALTRGAEALKLDRDYSDRPGYAEDFIWASICRCRPYRPGWQSSSHLFARRSPTPPKVS